MLCLSRKEGESVRINDDITVTVVEIRGNKVRLGFVAPHGTPVHRGEVYEKIQRESRTNKKCIVCNQHLGIPGGYANSGMCGPCCTGDAATIEEIGTTW